MILARPCTLAKKQSSAAVSDGQTFLTENRRIPSGRACPHNQHPPGEIAEETTVDEEEVFAYLAKQKKAVLLDYLRQAFQEMSTKQCRAVFGDDTQNYEQALQRHYAEGVPAN